LSIDQQVSDVTFIRDMLRIRCIIIIIVIIINNWYLYSARSLSHSHYTNALC